MQKKRKHRMIYELCSKQVLLKDEIIYAKLSYHMIGSPKDVAKRIVFNIILNLLTLNIQNENIGNVLDTTAHDLYIKLIVIVFKKDGILYTKTDFSKKGEFSGGNQGNWNKRIKKDLTLRTNITKPEYDKYSDEKYMKLLEEKTLQPKKNYHDLLKSVVMDLGTYLGFRGKRELTTALWIYLKLEILPNITKSIKLAPNGGFDKTSGLLINNPLAQTEHPAEEYYKNTPNHHAKLTFNYHFLSDPEQERLLCHVNTKSKTTAC